MVVCNVLNLCSFLYLFLFIPNRSSTKHLQQLQQGEPKRLEERREKAETEEKESDTPLHTYVCGWC